MLFHLPIQDRVQPRITSALVNMCTVEEFIQNSIIRIYQTVNSFQADLCDKIVDVYILTDGRRQFPNTHTIGESPKSVNSVRLKNFA